MKCGACTDKCHYYLGTADPKNMPVARQDLLRSVYRRYYTFAGKYFPEAGRRARHDQGRARRVVHLLPPVLAVPPLLGVLPLRHRHRRDLDGRARHHGHASAWARNTATKSSARCTRIGNNLGLPEPALADTLEGLEEDVKDETGVDVRFPLDVKGAEVLLVTPSADFFAEPHVDGLIGYAKVFHAAGI